MDRPKQKNIYYIPGILSLTILPIAFIIFAKNGIKERTHIVLPIIFADTSIPNRFPEIFKKSNNNFPPKRNYIDINLTGDNEKDNIKLDFAQVRIREILSQNDSIDGLHFSFRDSSQYWTFVKTIDILRFEKAKTYMPLDNDLWFYYFLPDTNFKKLDYKLFECATIAFEPKISWWIKTREEINHIWATSWKIILGFMAFIFSIFRIKKQKNGRQHLIQCPGSCLHEPNTGVL